MKTFITISIFILSLNVSAQDVHFSQFWNNNVQINPAMAGVSEANLRASAFYREQWGSSTSPFQSFGVNFDTRIDTKGSASFGMGLNAFRDVAGDNKLGTTQVRAIFSAILAINELNKISIGLSGGIEQRGFDPSTAKWNSQYSNGSYNPNLASGETFGRTSEVKGDLSAGIVYYYNSERSNMSSNDNFRMKIGASFNHILRPQFNWKTIESDKLYSNIIAHAEFLIGIRNSKWSLKPGILTQFQGPSKEILIGNQFRYRLKDHSRITGFIKGAYLNVGAYFRVGDALIPSLTFEFDKYSLGASYDINISKYRTASKGAGGFEISFIFKLEDSSLWSGSGIPRSRSRFR